jgi:hypothetical protein
MELTVPETRKARLISIESRTLSMGKMR